MLSGMLAAEQSRPRSRAGRTGDELAGYEDAWRARRSATTCRRCATSSRSGRSSAPCVGIAFGGLDMWTNTFGFSLFGTLRPWQAGLGDARARREIQADRLSEAGRRGVVRQALVGLPVEHQSRGGSAGSPRVKDMALQKQSEHDVYAGPSSTLLPGRRL